MPLKFSTHPQIEVNLCQQLCKKYGVLSHVQLGKGQMLGQRGLIAKDYIKPPGDRAYNLLEIPHKLIICDSPAHMKLYPKWIKKIINTDIDWELKIGAMLLFAIDNFQFWKSYQIFLPHIQQLQTPFIFSNKSLDLLVDKQLQQDIFDWKEQVESTFFKYIENNYQTNLNQYLRCVGCVQSRAFGFTSDFQHLDAFVPFLDLANHQINAKCFSDFDIENGLVMLKTYEKINPYEEIFISYGKKTNQEMFEQYGILQKSNVHDRVKIISEGKLKRDRLTYIMQNISDWNQKIQNTQTWQKLRQKYGHQESTIFQYWQEIFEDEQANTVLQSIMKCCCWKNVKEYQQIDLQSEIQCLQSIKKYCLQKVQEYQTCDEQLCEDWKELLIIQYNKQAKRTWEVGVHVSDILLELYHNQ